MIVIRPLLPSERVMVLTDWLAAYQASLDVRGVSTAAYKAGMARRIEMLIDRAQTVVAVDTAAPTAALGWCCAETDCIHFVYVKHDARRCGVAAELLSAVSPDARRYSHRTYRVQHLRRAKAMQFDPFAIEG